MRNFSAAVNERNLDAAGSGHRLIDGFIRQRMPAWLRQASAEPVVELRRLIAQHRLSQQRLAEATAAVEPVHAFALREYSRALSTVLPAGQPLGSLVWRNRVLEFGGYTLPLGEFVNGEPVPGVLRLMQNFALDSLPFDNSGLFAAGKDELLSGDMRHLIGICRTLNAGQRYQQILVDHLEAHLPLLAEDKRAGFALAVHVALLKGHIDAAVKVALQPLSTGASATARQPDTSQVIAYPGLLNVLGCRVHEALFVQLRGPDDTDQGVVIYRPGVALAPLRWFHSRREMHQALLAELMEPQSRDAFLQGIGLHERHVFAETLALRLKDRDPDLQVEGETGGGEVFERWAQALVERAKEDARRLLVPTAEVDAEASRSRLRAWKSFGWNLLSLGGFFVPAVGALLLAQLVKELCSQMFEGVEDWAAGHEHEALEHVLGVAQTSAAAGLTIGAGVAGERFIRSTFVDGMQAVALEDGAARLWHEDLSVYESAAQGAVLDSRGLYTRDGKYWVAADGRYYQVHQPVPDGPWRLCHPLRQGAYGPVVEHNGERFWRLPHESVQSWNDAAQMLERLWPQQPRLDRQRAQWLLQAAGSDVDELRGILVENRALPASLRDTLRRFEADGRIEAFYAALESGAGQQQDELLFSWCRQQLGITVQDAARAGEEMLQQAPYLRQQLFLHLSEVDVPSDAVVKVMLRDFPRVPAEYALELASTLSAEQRRPIELAAQLSLSVAGQVRSLSQLARLNRARQGLLLRNGYSDESGELALALLPRLDHWSFDRRLELRSGSSSGRLLAVLNPQGEPQRAIILARRDGQFGLYDHRGLALEAELEHADDLFQAIIACLTPGQRSRLGLNDDDPAGVLRRRVVSAMPGRHEDLLAVLGWRRQGRWFNPGQRLPDGRVGYPLGGTHSRSEELLDRIRWRLTVLYRGDSRVQINAHLDRILGSEDPFEALLYEEQNFQMLGGRLNTWVAQANDMERPARHRLASLLRAAWRRQLPMDPLHAAQEGRVLDLSGVPVTSLPALSATIDFHFVTTLVMVNTQVSVVPEAFFSCFRTVRRLNLSLNRLRALPSGLRHMSQLQCLQLRYNRIQMTAEAEATLAQLPQLSDLDLSFNALSRFNLRAAQLTALRHLNLSHCRLSAWPDGLQDCEWLLQADLSFNRLASVPEPILNMPYLFRAALHVDGNPLSLAQRERLSALPGHGHEPAPEVDAPSARAVWVSGPRAEEIGACWDRLFASGEREQLEKILGRLRETKDYQEHHADLALQVWGLLQDLDEDPALMQTVMAIANDETTCADSVIERFSDIRVQAMKFKASRSGGEQAALLQLGLGLFRLSRVEAFVRMDLQARAALQQPVDDIEVRLYYIVRLAREMNLPGQPSSMVFENMAQVDEHQLDEARAFVRAAETPEQQATFLGYQAFWSDWLEQQHALAFQALDERFAELGGSLSEQEVALGAQAYQAQWDELEHARLSERFQLTVLLTRQVLQASELGAGASVPAAGPSGN